MTVIKNIRNSKILRMNHYSHSSPILNRKLINNNNTNRTRDLIFERNSTNYLYLNHNNNNNNNKNKNTSGNESSTNEYSSSTLSTATTSYSIPVEAIIGNKFAIDSITNNCEHELTNLFTINYSKIASASHNIKKSKMKKKKERRIRVYKQPMNINIENLNLFKNKKLQNQSKMNRIDYTISNNVTKLTASTSTSTSMSSEKSSGLRRQEAKLSLLLNDDSNENFKCLCCKNESSSSGSSLCSSDSFISTFNCSINSDLDNNCQNFLSSTPRDNHIYSKCSHRLTSSNKNSKRKVNKERSSYKAWKEYQKASHLKSILPRTSSCNSLLIQKKMLGNESTTKMINSKRYKSKHTAKGNYENFYNLGDFMVWYI
jgi:hypothetical protein